MIKEEGFSVYGKYTVFEKLDLHLPRTEIHIERKIDGLLSYYRKNSENQEIRKTIPQSDEDICIELCPILPLHLPARKTNDLIFLRLSESIFVEKKSTVSILLQFPIEIGIFLINSKDGSKDLFDCFACKPMHSRYALYGTPEHGNLCMYSKVKLLQKDELDPYIFARIRVTLTNNLNHGAFVGKLVFPITRHIVYYKDNSSEVHIDDVRGTMKKDTNKEIIKINLEDFADKDKDWKLVTYSNRKDDDGDDKSFVMDKGFD